MHTPYRGNTANYIISRTSHETMKLYLYSTVTFLILFFIIQCFECTNNNRESWYESC